MRQGRHQDFFALRKRLLHEIQKILVRKGAPPRFANAHLLNISVFLVGHI